MTVEITETETIAVGPSIREIARLRKIYPAMVDDHAAEHHLIRVIDESGEDYLCPEGYFVQIELSQAPEQTLSAIAEPVLQVSA